MNDQCDSRKKVTICLSADFRCGSVWFHSPIHIQQEQLSCKETQEL